MNFNDDKKQFNFRDDLTSEHAVNEFLCKHFYEPLKKSGKIKSYTSTNDLNEQHSGIDVKIKLLNNTIVNIDEKAAIHYAKKDLNKEPMPTFAFEISYEKEGSLREGWLTNPKYKDTHKYLLCWLWIAENSNVKKIRYEDIIKLEVMFIDKKEVQNFIINKVTKNQQDSFKQDSFKRLAFEQRKNMETLLLENSTNHEEASVGEKKYPKWFLTGRTSLAEKPLNILLNRRQLLNLASSHWVITKTGPQRLDENK